MAKMKILQVISPPAKSRRLDRSVLYPTIWGRKMRYAGCTFVYNYHYLPPSTTPISAIVLHRRSRWWEPKNCFGRWSLMQAKPSCTTVKHARAVLQKRSSDADRRTKVCRANMSAYLCANRLSEASRLTPPSSSSDSPLIRRPPRTPRSVPFFLFRLLS